MYDIQDHLHGRNKCVCEVVPSHRLLPTARGGGLLGTYPYRVPTGIDAVPAFLLFPFLQTQVKRRTSMFQGVCVCVGGGGLSMR